MNWRALVSANRAARSSPPSCAPAFRRRSTRRRANEEHFPSTIDPRIYHVKLIREHLGDLRGKRVLDVGCGKGRFARVFHEQEPEAEMWGLDISEEMLRFVPEGIHTRAGSMTELPFDDGFFDGAYATESLEHAVEIEKAVGEMCRVVKPGGTHRDHRQERRALGPAGNSRMGEMVHAQGTGAPAAAALPRGLEPVHLVLGRCGAGRAVPGVAGGEVEAS